MPKQVTVEEASPSPPPLPKEPLPTSANAAASSSASAPGPGSGSSGEGQVADQPITSLGDGESDDEEGGEGDEEGVWDPSEERLPGENVRKGSRKKDKGKGKAKADGTTVAAADGAHPWQAVWSPEKNAWYFWNTSTGEVTWTNPLAPSDAASSSASSSTGGAPPLPSGPAPNAMPIQPSRIGGIPDIDPDLAYLLPSESRYIPGAEPGDLQTANFNSRNGKFNVNNNDYAFERLAEYNKEKKFNSKYFDQEKWEAEMRERNLKRSLEGGDKGKISKKDMDRFKKKRQEKRMRSQAWLRD